MANNGGSSGDLSGAEVALDEVARRLRRLTGVRVGLPRDSNPYPDGTSVIMVGAVHEFGNPEKNIPERSWLRAGIRRNRNKYKTLARRLAQRVTRGQLTPDLALRTLGEVAKGDVVQYITALDTPPLKYREGNPLIDTGHLRQSITYVVGLTDDN